MNLWKDDPTRQRNYQRAALRRFKRTARTLLGVIGAVVFALALFLGCMALVKQGQTRDRLLWMALGYAAGGALALGLYFLIFKLPEIIEERSSESHRSRRRESRERHERHNRNEGIALVLALFMLALVSTLVLESQITARALLRRNQSIANMAALRRAGADAIRAACQRLADDEDLAVDTTNDTWFAAEEVITPSGISTRTVVRDESRLFDLNNLSAKNVPAKRAPRDILGDAFALAGVFSSSAAVHALEDWVDADQTGLREARSYEARQPPYTTPNRPLQSWAELLSVADWKRSFFDHHPRESSSDTFNSDFTDAVTLIPVRRERPFPLNANTATKTALSAVLGFEHDDLVKAIIALREMRPLRSLEAFAIATDPETSAALLPYLDVRSRFFTVESRAHANDLAAVTRALVMRDTAGQVEVLQWVF